MGLVRLMNFFFYWNYLPPKNVECGPVRKPNSNMKNGKSWKSWRRENEKMPPTPFVKRLVSKNGRIVRWYWWIFPPEVEARSGEKNGRVICFTSSLTIQVNRYEMLKNSSRFWFKYSVISTHVTDLILLSTHTCRLVIRNPLEWLIKPSWSSFKKKSVQS